MFDNGGRKMILEINNLIKRYNDFLAVDNVSMSIEEGEIFGLLGPNGAGKTTTISALTGLTKIDGGEVKIFGKNMKSHEMEIKREIGIVPQEIAVSSQTPVPQPSPVPPTQRKSWKSTWNDFS